MLDLWPVDIWSLRPWSILYIIQCRHPNTIQCHDHLCRSNWMKLLLFIQFATSTTHLSEWSTPACPRVQNCKSYKQPWTHSASHKLIKSLCKSSKSSMNTFKNIHYAPDCGMNFALNIFARCAVLYCTKICPLYGFVTTIVWSSEPDNRYWPLSFHETVFTHPLWTLSRLCKLRHCKKSKLSAKKINKTVY